MALQLTIVTPEGEAFSDSVDTVVLPGSEGDFGVLEGMTADEIREYRGTLDPMG